MCNELGMNACIRGTNKIEYAKKLVEMGVAFITSDYLYSIEESEIDTAIQEIRL